MNAAEYGNFLGKMIVEEIQGQPSTGNDWLLMARRVVLALDNAGLYTPPKPFVPCQCIPMNEAEAKRFAASPVDLAGSKYNGEPVDEVPREYLCLISDPTDWKNDLARWLKTN